MPRKYRSSRAVDDPRRWKAARDAEAAARRDALLAAEKARREAAEALEYPFDHVLREGRGYDVGAGYRWRHTWANAAGDRIVATVPTPLSGNAYEDSEGLAVLRRVRDALHVQRELPTSRVDLFEGEKKYVVVTEYADEGGGI